MPPRKPVGKRAEVWELKMRPELLHPTLASRHKQMAFQMREVAFSLDRFYEDVARILDDAGVFGTVRLLYRSFGEELWRLRSNYTSRTLEIEANAVAVKYLLYGADGEILQKIGNLAGIEVFGMLRGIIKEAVEEALEGRLLAEVKDKSVAANEAIFNDISIDERGVVVLQIVADAAMHPIFVRNAKDIGAFNEGNDLTANCVYEFFAQVEEGDIINFKASAAASITARVWWKPA